MSTSPFALKKDFDSLSNIVNRKGRFVSCLDFEVGILHSGECNTIYYYWIIFFQRLELVVNNMSFLKMH